MPPIAEEFQFARALQLFSRPPTRTGSLRALHREATRTSPARIKVLSNALGSHPGAVLLEGKYNLLLSEPFLTRAVPVTNEIKFRSST